MGNKLFLLKPNYTTISTTATDGTNGVGTVGSVTTTTITLNKNVYAYCEFETKTSSVRSDWIYITRGTYTYCWKIVNCSNANPSVITIDGTTTNAGIQVGDAFEIRVAVSAGCNWTSPSTITYIELQPESIAYQDVNEIKITRFVNAGAVIVNMKKFADTMAVSKWRLGNSDTDQTASIKKAYQLNRALSYILGYWPDTSPKYSIFFYYNPDGYSASAINPGSEDKSKYKYRAGGYRQIRALLTKYTPNEDFVNNLTIDQIAFEVF